MRSTFSAALVALVAVAIVNADPVPTTPDASSVYDQGSQCDIAWEADSSGVWKIMNIQLMTGDNFQMIPLSTVATVDGTDSNNATFSYPCLAVTPNAPIYFYQFSSPAPGTSPLWTTRFLLAGPNGEHVPAPNATQPGTNAAIPWGIGSLQNPSQAVPPPSYEVSATGGSATPSGSVVPISSGSVNSTSISSTSAISSPPLSASPISGTSNIPSGFTTSSVPTQSSVATSGTTTGSSSAASASASTSGSTILIVARSALAIPIFALISAICL